jgi:hypothetical protein
MIFDLALSGSGDKTSPGASPLALSLTNVIGALMRGQLCFLSRPKQPGVWTMCIKPVSLLCTNTNTCPSWQQLVMGHSSGATAKAGTIRIGLLHVGIPMYLKPNMMWLLSTSMLWSRNNLLHVIRGCQIWSISCRSTILFFGNSRVMADGHNSLSTQNWWCASCRLATRQQLIDPYLLEIHTTLL